MSGDVVNLFLGIAGSAWGLFNSLWNWKHERAIKQFDAGIRGYDLGERQAVSDLALNPEITADVFAHGNRLLLKTTVRLRNASRRAWCIPAIYVATRGWQPHQPVAAGPTMRTTHFPQSRG